MTLRTVPRRLLALVLPLAACSSGQLPPGAALAISPATRTIDIVERLDGNGRCRIDANNHVDLPIVVSLRDAQGSPIGDTVLDVYVDFAANTFSGYPVLALYRDRNGNGVVDEATELVSGPEDGIARVATSRYGGEGRLPLRANLSCAYRGGVFAVADGVSASSSIEISASEGVVGETRGDGASVAEPRS